MIFILHGENASQSRSLILQLQKRLKADSRTEISIAEITPSRLLELSNSFDIFSKAPFIVLDISSMGRMKVDEYVEILKKIPPASTVVLFSSKELSKTNAFVKNMGILKAKAVDSAGRPAPSVFEFADLVFTGRRKESYMKLKEMIVSEEDPIGIFTILCYNLRNIALTKFQSPLAGKLAPFVRRKVQSQSSKFTENSIRRLYEEFYKIDKDVKTGNVSQDIIVPLAVEKVLEKL